MDAVVRNSTRFWEGMAGFSWPGEGAAAGGKGSGEYNPWEPAMDAWKQFQESCSSGAFTGQFDLVREEGFKQFEKMAKGGWENFVSMGDGLNPSMNWGQYPFGLGIPDMFGGKGAFKEVFKLMSGEMNRFVSIPPLGLSRNYQEKVVEVVEKGNQFLLTLAEYMFLMFSPLEQSMQMVQATMEGFTDEQRRSLTPETVYETWLKELEQGYFTLYGSEEYLGLLKRLVSAMGEFNMARQNFISDFLKLMGVPSENDLDDLYRDLYTVKKKLSDLEKSVEKMTQAATVAKPAKKAPVKSKEASMAATSVRKAPVKSKEGPKVAKLAAKAPSTPKAAPSTPKEAPSTPKAAPSTPKAAPSTSKEVPMAVKSAEAVQAQPKEAPRDAKPAEKSAKPTPAAAKSAEKIDKSVKSSAKPAGKTP